MSSQEFLNQLADIEIPTAPQVQTEFLWLIIAISIGVALTVYALRRKKTHQAKPKPLDCSAITRLDQLELQWQQGVIDSRHAAYQLATLLRLGLNLNQLTPKHLSDEQWPDTISLLQELRYNKTSSLTISSHTFKLIRKWLEQHDKGQS